jgi:hypothetical protein
MATKNRAASTAPAAEQDAAVIEDDAEDFGPVLNEDGTPSDVTLAILTGQPTKSAAKPRAKFCYQLQSEGLGEAGCHRLPRHKGDHRATLKQPKAAKVAAKTSKASPKGKKVSLTAFRAELNAAIEDGSMTPSQAMSKLSAFLTRK